VCVLEIEKQTVRVCGYACVCAWVCVCVWAIACAGKLVWAMGRIFRNS